MTKSSTHSDDFQDCTVQLGASMEPVSSGVVGFCRCFEWKIPCGKIAREILHFTESTHGFLVEAVFLQRDVDRRLRLCQTEFEQKNPNVFMLRLQVHGP